MNRRTWKFLGTVLSCSSVFTSFAFTFFPESLFAKWMFEPDWPQEYIIILNRVVFFLIVSVLVLIVMYLIRRYRTSIMIKGNDFTIKVEYGDIFKAANCKKVINFDECFTTKIGDAPEEIKPGSVCGKFLTGCGIDKEAVIQTINNYKAEQAPTEVSAFRNTPSYRPGTIIPFKDDYLLLAFGKLDEQGLCRMTREDYLACLDVLWKNIDTHHAMHDVAVPVLGSRITRFNDELLDQQKLVDMMIATYKLSSARMKGNVLRIVCLRSDDFSLNRVGEYI
jgi:hypothetical protein